MLLSSLLEFSCSLFPATVGLALGSSYVSGRTTCSLSSILPLSTTISVSPFLDAAHPSLLSALSSFLAFSYLRSPFMGGWGSEASTYLNDKLHNTRRKKDNSELTRKPLRRLCPWHATPLPLEQKQSSLVSTQIWCRKLTEPVPGKRELENT